MRNLSEADKETVQQRKLSAALVAYICCLQLPFLMVESEFFHGFLLTVSDLIRFLPTSHTTIKTWVMDSFTEREKEVFIYDPNFSVKDSHYL